MTDKKAKSADYRVYRTSAELDTLLEETGGEITPEVEALEDALAADLNDLAEVGVGMMRDADAECVKIAAERTRLALLAKHHARRKERGKHLLRRVADECGETCFDAGLFQVSIQKPTESVKQDGWEARSDGWIDDATVQSTAMAGLIDRGLARWGARPDLAAIKRELKKGADVAGYILSRSKDKKVVVR